jgi:nitroreductase
MDVLQAISGRRSIRKYTARPVEPEKVRQVLNAARLAPSWKNMQCWRFLVLDTQARKEALLCAFTDDNPGKKALIQAPVVIVVCADPTRSEVSHGMEYYIADAAIAFQNLCLAAYDIGLGTCWLGMYDEAAIKELLAIPAGIRVVGVTPLGFPDQEPSARPRLELTQVAYYNDWGNSDAD